MDRSAIYLLRAENALATILPDTDFEPVAQAVMAVASALRELRDPAELIGSAVAALAALAAQPRRVTEAERAELALHLAEMRQADPDVLLDSLLDRLGMTP